ncbi:MAG: protein phosphatase 2C domain-containing protein [Flaviflexus sp.]|nr:protein phosphatase 2C domain-containing protein [Flaviflexus sp.]
MSVQIRYAARSDVGAVRKQNQDAGYASGHLLVLADGMGGAAGGDVASSVTVGHLAELDEVHRADDLLPLLKAAVTDAHDHLVELAREDPKLAGLGTTCIAILRSSNKLAMVHIGDSRAYLLRGDHLIQVTKDHTLVQYLLDHGNITPEQAENHPRKNVIMRALGDTEGGVELDESMREAVIGDRWLLCSDGLFGVVSNDTIAHTLATIDDLEACADELIDLALAAGAPDNVTVVLADIVDDRDLTAATVTPQAPVIVGSAEENPRPSRGRGAAARAAALRAHEDTATAELPAFAPPQRKRRWPAILGAVLGIVLLVTGGLFAGWVWTKSQYYVYVANGNIGIYQGIPQALGPIELSRLKERTDVPIEDLNETARARLEQPVTRSSYEEATRFVTELKNEYSREREQRDREEVRRERQNRTEEMRKKAESTVDPSADPAKEPSDGATGRDDQ